MMKKVLCNDDGETAAAPYCVGNRELVVNFACFVTCLSNPGNKNPGNKIIEMKTPGYKLNCISVAVNKNNAIELYLECSTCELPLTKLLRIFEDMGLCCVSIFTFGPRPRSNGAPEALARIRYRVTQCGFIGYMKGAPSVEECLDFDIRDKFSNWVKFTADQIEVMMSTDGSRPNDIVEWCVVVFSGDTSLIEARLRKLTAIRSGSFRQYYIRGFECMRMPRAARIYLEVEPVVKTVLLHCLIAELGSATTSTTSTYGLEILTFPRNHQFRALAFVSELGGVLTEKGKLSAVDVPAKIPAVSCVITRFTEKDLAIWGDVVNESAPLHWSVRERDAELVRLRADVAFLQTENTLIRRESDKYSQQCAGFLCALNEIKDDRERLRGELEAISSVMNGWNEWESSRVELKAKDKCIVQLKKQLCESIDQIQRLQQGELVSNDEGIWFCADGGSNNNNEEGPISGLSAKVKYLEQRLESEFEGGIVFDEERGKNVETEGKMWTLVKWQARELDIYRNAFGSLSVRDFFNELDFSVNVSTATTTTTTTTGEDV
jgi:hypothetical protein